MRSILALAALFLLSLEAQAYPVSEGRRTETLTDGTQVNLILDSEKTEGAHLLRLIAQSGGRRYYYLPTNLRLAKRQRRAIERAWHTAPSQAMRDEIAIFAQRHMS